VAYLDKKEVKMEVLEQPLEHKLKAFSRRKKNLQRNQRILQRNQRILRRNLLLTQQRNQKTLQRRTLRLLRCCLDLSAHCLVKLELKDAGSEAITEASAQLHPYVKQTKIEIIGGATTNVKLATKAIARIA
jgi:hypothetical protein